MAGRSEGIRGLPYYYFEAVTSEGIIQKKLLKARDKTDADTRLRELGLRPMLIESYRVKKKKTKRKALHTRHIIRNTFAMVVSISLVGGVAAYLIALDLSSIQRFDVQKLAKGGIVPEAEKLIHAKTPEEREFALGVKRELDASYPDTFGGITVEGTHLMIVYVKERRNLTDDNLHQITSLIYAAFQRHFDIKSSIVLMVEVGSKETIAQAQGRRGEELRVEVF
jgi:hypothetical protein